MTEEYLCGVDISHWQDDDDNNYDINWSKMADEGVVFAFLKASEGDWYTDRQFLLNWNYASAHNIALYPYHFIRPQRTGEENADYFKDVLTQVSPIRKIAGDLEEDDNMDSRRVTSVAQNFMLDFPKESVLYTADWFTSVFIKPWSGWKDYLLWVMTYPYYYPNGYDQPHTLFPDFETFFDYLAGGTKFPTMPRDCVNKEPIWDDWMIWQFTCKGDGKKYGLERGSIDLNIAKPEFLEIVPPPPPPPPPEDCKPSPFMNIAGILTIGDRIHTYGGEIPLDSTTEKE